MASRCEWNPHEHTALPRSQSRSSFEGRLRPLPRPERCNRTLCDTTVLFARVVY
jgi:hypothetical protein